MTSAPLLLGLLESFFLGMRAKGDLGGVIASDLRLPVVLRLAAPERRRQSSPRAREKIRGFRTNWSQVSQVPCFALLYEPSEAPAGEHGCLSRRAKQRRRARNPKLNPALSG